MHLKSRIRQLLPWFAGTLILVIVLWRVPLADMIQAIRLARLEIFLPLVALACLAWFLIDAKAFAVLFGRFNTPLTFSQACELRGLTYLLTPIHWNVGRAAVIARMHTTHRVPLLEATSSMAFYQTLDAILVSALCWIGLVRLQASATRDALEPLVALFCLALLAYLVIIRSSRFSVGPLERLRNSPFHRTHRLASSRDILTILSLRLAYYSVFLGLYVWGTSAFGLALPFALIVASVPIIQGIGALPISPAGLGTQQAAMLFLFSGFGPEGAIVAFGLSFPLLCIVFRSLIGWPYLGRFSISAPIPGVRSEPGPGAQAATTSGSIAAAELE
jgi:hypothetical protein